ncbi:hypothetical protein ACJIZ3_018128 [Penstemon smallii]|uniref:Uncharacterized protein n=1 Tax=Penstemon smallii TaxID=265156 RepID=A0ABD3SXG2_9LAMI
MGYISYKKALHIICQFLIIIIVVELRSCLAKNSPANFVFGDSLVDSGNNNYIISLSKADCVPNGIDFGHPTGRYTNGRTIIDIIGQELGFNGFTPPYLAPSTAGPTILQGVNYASGGGGILNQTGKIFVGRINLDAQMDNFANTRQEIISKIGSTAAMELFKHALFSVTIGSNDFINNYLTPILSKLEQKLIPPEIFVEAMISRFRVQLTRVYSMGGRKIVVANVGPIGCIPYQREINIIPVGGGAGAGAGNDIIINGSSCAVFPNELAQLFNAQLRGLVMELCANLQGSQFIYADVYHIVDDIIQNYISFGFENANSSCCYVAGVYGALIPCGPKSKVCEDRSKFVFWDPYHPSDATNVLIAKRLLDGDPAHIWPINIRNLMAN